MATSTKIKFKVVNQLPTERPLETGNIYKVKQLDGELVEYVVDSAGEPVISGISQPDKTKLKGLKTQAEITEDINSMGELASAQLIPISGTVLPQGANVPIYITTKGKAELIGGEGGTTFTQSGGSPTTVPEGFLRIGYYDRPTNLWTFDAELKPLPQTEIVDNTTSVDPNEALSANQGTLLDPIGIDLSGLDYSVISKLPSDINTRFTSGDGFQNATTLNLEAVDAFSMFGYKGLALKTSNTLTNWYYFMDAKRIFNNPSYSGGGTYNLNFNIELFSTTTKTIQVSILRVNADNSETQVKLLSSVNLTANTVFTLSTDANILLSSGDLNTMKGLEIRFFSGDGTSSIGELFLGRVLVTSKPLALKNGKIDYASQVILEKSQKRIEKATNPYKTDLSLFDGWKNPKVLPASTSERFLNGSGFNTALTFEKIDSSPYFNYKGNAIKATNNPANFYYFLDTTNVISHPKFNDRVYYSVELYAVAELKIIFRSYKVTDVSTETLLSESTFTIPAGTRHVVNFAVNGSAFTTTGLTVRGFEYRFFNNAGNSFANNLIVGRTLMYTEPYESGAVTFSEDYRANLRAQNEGEVVLKDVVCSGDSLTFQGYPAILSSLTGRVVVNSGVGSQKSYQIRDRFLANTNFKSMTAVFWYGRNNIADASFVDFIPADVYSASQHLNHSDFIVLGVINGNYPQERKSSTDRIRYDRLIELEDKLSKIYGNKFLNIRRKLIEQYTNGVRLSASFTQPAIESTVQVTVNDTSKFTAGDLICIGFKSLVDRYTIVTVDSSTQMTIRLTHSNKISPSGTVENEFYDIGGTASYGYLIVWKYQDYIDYNDDTVQASWRTDNIHLTTEGYNFVAKCVAEKLKELDI